MEQWMRGNILDTLMKASSHFLCMLVMVWQTETKMLYGGRGGFYNLYLKSSQNNMRVKVVQQKKLVYSSFSGYSKSTPKHELILTEINLKPYLKTFSNKGQEITRWI